MPVITAHQWMIMRRAGIHPEFEKAVKILTYEFYQEQITAHYLTHEDGLSSIFLVWHVEGQVVRFAQLMQINEYMGGVIARFNKEYLPIIQAMLVSLLNSEVVKHMNLVYIWTNIGNDWMPSYQNLAVDRWENKQLEFFANGDTKYSSGRDMDALAWFFGGGEAQNDETIGTIPAKPEADKPTITIDPLDLPPTEPDKWDSALGDEDEGTN